VSARLDQSLAHTYLKDTEPATEEMMKTRVVKLGPGSWAVFVNDQRHHETFRTRAAARSEAKRQTETNKIDNES
jgi:sarcosine oxidase gamma subunit